MKALAATISRAFGRFALGRNALPARLDFERAEPDAVETYLARLDRRDRQLLLVAIISIVLLVAGIVAKDVPAMVLAGEIDFSKTPLDELVILTAILIPYLLITHREVRKLRRTVVEKVIRIETLNTRVRELSSFLEISSRVNSLSGLEETLNLITKNALQCLQGDQAALLLLDVKSKILITKAAAGSGTKFTFRDRGRAGEGIAAWVAKECQPLLVADHAEFAKYAIATPSPEDNLVSAIAVPLVLNGAVCGVLSVTTVDDERARVFNEYDLKLLRLFADYAASCIHNARLYEEIKIKNDKLVSSMQVLKQAQDHLVQAEKLTAVGEMIAGVAHELNNPLTAILGYAQLLQSLDGPAEFKEYATSIRQETDRCRKIVENFLSLARRNGSEKTSCDVNEILTMILNLKKHTLNQHGVQVCTDLDPQLPPVIADPHLLRQVFVNIITNADQALQERAGERILTIVSSSDGAALRIRFTDSGPGIPPEILPRIFDPFFTTRDVGSGSGLGLSICYSIVKEHGGTIAVESEPRHGTTFTVELPLRLAAANEVKAPTVTPVIVEPTSGKPIQRILVVDDEEPILSLFTRYLSGEGYPVDVARSSAEAMKRVQGQPYGAVIMDLRLGSEDGRDLYRGLVALQPNLQHHVVFMSGDLEDPPVADFLRETGGPCLAKPFQLDDVKAVLGRLVPA
jgi:signal transduction histidine kinase